VKETPQGTQSLWKDKTVV